MIAKACTTASMPGHISWKIAEKCKHTFSEEGIDTNMSMTLIQALENTVSEHQCGESTRSLDSMLNVDRGHEFEGAAQLRTYVGPSRMFPDPCYNHNQAYPTNIIHK